MDEWYQSELESQGYEDAKDLIETFTKEDTSSASKYDVEDRSDLDWPEQTWNFTCSTTETSTWAEGGRKFGELMEKATGGKIKLMFTCRPADKRKPVRRYSGADLWLPGIHLDAQQPDLLCI